MNENVVKLENNFNQVIERKIAVIFVTDVVGFSKSMEQNEDETLRSFRACRDILDKLFAEHGGRIFNTAGDSVLAEFQSAVSAVVCANEFQKLLKERNNSVSDNEKMHFRIGLNMGDVIVEGENLYGDGVNVAARLEALSQPSGVCLSKSIMDFVNKKTELLFNDLGEQQIKNTLLGKAKAYILILFLYHLLTINSSSENQKRTENFAVLTVLDKVNSQSDIVEIEIGKEYIFKNLSINILKCNNSKFDDDPEVTAYMQVKDIINIDENKVYIFNDWTFASSPSIRPFDHPVYDIWLKKCYS